MNILDSFIGIGGYGANLMEGHGFWQVTYFFTDGTVKRKRFDNEAAARKCYAKAVR